MGTIKPKPEEKVRLKKWQRVEGVPAPPVDLWTGEVVKNLGNALHNVRRHYDGKIVTMHGADLSYLRQK